MKSTISMSDVLKYQNKTNSQAAYYMLRLYGFEGFDGSLDEYMFLMKSLRNSILKNTSNNYFGTVKNK